MKKLLLLNLLALSSFSANAQLWVDTTNYTPEIMVNDFFGNSSEVTISNVTFSGTPIQAAFFEGSQSNVGMNAGLLLTSGDALGVGNPADFFATGSAYNIGDLDLEAFNTGMTVPSYDAAALEFDIVANVTSASFKYVFGSEEYPEYVGGSFNDAFAFFISGEGYNGLTNIAFIPGSSTTVAINNVNAELNSEYYIDNTTGTSVAYDAFTTPLYANATLVPGATYHIKIVIADFGDNIFDSGVFLSVESLGGLVNLPTQPEFLVEADENDPNTVQFMDESRYATSWLWDFGDGTTSTERNPIHTYALDLATHKFDVKLTTTNYCCTQEKITTVGTETTNTGNITEAPLRAFPNPSKGNITLDLGNASEGTLRICDMQGKVLSEGAVQQGEQINLDAFGKGIYFLTIRTATQVAEQRVINIK